MITAVIGSGVLSMAWSIAHLGWIGGPLSVVAFAGITLVQSSLLCDCYKSPDPVHGPVRNPTYMEAVRFYLGESVDHHPLCSCFIELQYVNGSTLFFA